MAIAASRGAPAASRVFVLLAMARVLPAEEFAGAAYAIAVAEAARFLSDGGLDLWGVRSIAHATDSDDLARRTSSLATVKVLIGCISAAVVALVTGLYGPGGVPIAALAGLLVLSSEAFGIASIYHLARSTPHKLVIVSVGTALIVMSASTLCLARGAGVTSVCAIIATGEALAAAYVLATLRAAGLLRSFSGIWVSSFDVIRSSAPMMGYGAITAIYVRLDTIALNALSVAALATYTVAFRAMQPFAFAFGAVTLAIYSGQVIGAQRTKADTGIMSRKLLIYVFGAVAAASLVAYFTCAWLISKLVPQHVDALAVLELLCAMLPLHAVNSVILYSLMSRGMFRFALGMAVWSLLSTAMLLWVLVPSLGPRGAAFALLGCQVLNAVVLLGMLARPRQVPVPA